MIGYTPGIIDGGGYDLPFSGGATGPEAGYLDASAGGAPLDLGNILSVGKGAFKALAPGTYSDATSWLPSLGDLFGGSGAAGGTGGAASGLSGAATAFAPTAAFLAWAQLMSALNQNTDHPITLGSGYTSLEDGFTGGSGPKMAEAGALGGLYVGDRSWYEGGDPSLVEPMDTAVGSMSWKKSLPAYSVGGAPYQTPGLAAGSGRQIARGMMGLPVEYEALGNAYDPQNRDIGMQGQFFANASLPVYDAPAQLPTNWDEMIDMRRQFGPGEGQSMGSPVYDQFYGGLNDRQREWADADMKTSAMWKYTGEASPDYGAVVDDLSGVQGSMQNLSPSGRSAAGYNWGTY